eukprot:1156303-Pelagomonas_calceolata.AAC.2
MPFYDIMMSFLNIVSRQAVQLQNHLPLNNLYQYQTPSLFSSFLPVSICNGQEVGDVQYKVS